MANLPPIYNSRVLKLYAAFLNAHYPHIDLLTIIKEAHLTKFEIEDPGHWLTQEQVDLFHQKALEASGRADIAREVGRFATLSDVTGPIKKHLLGLLNISSIYLLLAKLYPMLSRGAKVQARKLHGNKVEVTVIPEPAVQEKPYQCENRLGMFESLSIPFSGKYAKIEHDQCIHHGDKICRYEISWEEPSFKTWKKYSLIGFFSGLTAAVIGLFLLPLLPWLIFIALGAMALVGVCYYGHRLERQELIRTIQNQGSVAEDHIKEVDYRYRGALLVQKIGQATSELLDMNRMVQVVINHIRDYLDFDRGLIMLADEKRSRLVYKAGYGFDNIKSQLLQKTQFRLDNMEARGLFVQSFWEQRPILVDDVSTMQKIFSSRSQSFAKEIGTQALICIPIVYENHSLGILAVDNIKTKRPLTQSDVNLLMGVASQTALSIFSAKARKELQDSEERYRSLYDQAPTPYFTISAKHGAIINCNEAATTLLGHPRAHLIGSYWLNYFFDDQGNRARAQWIFNVLQRGQSVHSEEICLIHQNGQPVWANLSMEPYRNPQGRVVEGRCILVDTTERKKLEDKLRHAQRMEAMGTLAGGVAHDLSNILAAIVSYPDLLLMDIDPDSYLHEPLTKIKRAGIRAAAIVQDLLTLARRGVQFTEVIDIKDIVLEFLKSPECESLRAQHPDVQIFTLLEEPRAAIRGSAVHLIKTLMNIVINAAEAMPDGGEIYVETYQEQIKETDLCKNRKTGQYVVVAVKDNGTGIAEEDLNRIFEPFFTKKVMGRSGTGLGMAIVWATVEDHNGFIEIQSKVGAGTTVRLYFPATSEARAHQPAAALIQDMMGCGESVLVIDDEAEHREIAIQMLTRLGYQVKAVDSGEAALEQMEQLPPDIVVLDMILGTDVDGLAVYRRLLSIKPGQKAVITSAFSESLRVKEALELGAGAYIKKPFSMKEMAAAVRHELDRKSGGPA